MAALTKHAAQAVPFQLKHNCREFDGNRPTNAEIDPERTPLNYFLTPPDRGGTAKAQMEYFKKRMAELYHIKRKDLVATCEWCVTAPKELPDNELPEFFQKTYRFICDTYGEENVVQAVVHFDEGVKGKDGEIIEGRPHIHVTFIPVIPVTDTNERHKQAHFSEKVCAKKVITKAHLQHWHDDFQRYLDTETDLKCKVKTGVTAGKNRTVEQLKRVTKEIELQKARNRVKDLETEIESLTLQLAIAQAPTVDINHELVESLRGKVKELEMTLSTEREGFRTEHETLSRALDKANARTAEAERKVSDLQRKLEKHEVLPERRIHNEPEHGKSIQWNDRPHEAEKLPSWALKTHSIDVEVSQ